MSFTPGRTLIRFLSVDVCPDRGVLPIPVICCGARLGPMPTNRAGLRRALLGGAPSPPQYKEPAERLLTGAASVSASLATDAVYLLGVASASRVTRSRFFLQIVLMVL